MNETIIMLVGKLIGLAVVALLAYIAPKVKSHISALAGSEAVNMTISIVGEFVRAADQMFKPDDPTGEIRKSYVKSRLQELGYEITEEINAYIEAEVFKL